MSALLWILTHLEKPALILAIIPAFFLYFLLLRKNYVTMHEEPQTKKQKLLLRAILLITRTLLTLFLLIILAGPYAIHEHTIQGDPYITLFVDNSSSITVFQNAADQLESELKRHVAVERETIGAPEKSNLGDGILAHLQPRQNILLISDGNNNDGASMGDVALLASRMNATINAITLSPIHDDTSVSILGPSKTMENVENTFTIPLHRVGTKKTVHLTVTVDGTTVLDKTTDSPAETFSHSFSQGYHKITATIDSADFFTTNNIYYKTVKAVPKPEILYLSEKESPLAELLKTSYKVTAVQQLPNNLNNYYAIIANDIAATTATNWVEPLTEYITEGNGLVVVGGKNSYDFGEYKNSLFETILPVTVGTPGKKKGHINVVIVIDISGSTSAAVGGGKAVDVEKMLAVSVLKDLAPEENLAVIAFNTAAYVISDLSKVYEKVNLEDRITSLRDGGGTLIGIGLIKAMELLDLTSGSKNIILISDGKTQGESISRQAAQAAANKGIKIFTVGVGQQTNELLMQELADITNGISFQADQSSRLKILFGKTEDEPDSNQLTLVVLNHNHFITADLELTADIHGYNQVTPKTSANLLVTTNTGVPILTVWRLGLGRIATLATDDGNGWNPDLLKKPDSKLTTRVLNWAIGDPDRKSKDYLETRDTRINEPTEITIKSDTQPTAKDLTFYKIDRDLYSATITPTTTGFQTISSAVFAANYPSEYETLGMSDELTTAVHSTNGQFFNPKDIQAIVDFAQTQAKRTINEKEYILWPWFALVILIYIIEIFIRRIIRKD